MRCWPAQLAARAFSAGDVGDYERLMALGARANLAENFATAETAYRAALALQQKALGRDDPDTVKALMHLALQVSDQGRFAEADTLFGRPTRWRRAPADQAALRAAAALPGAACAEPGPATSRRWRCWRQAEAGYAALVPPREPAGRRADRSAVQLASAADDSRSAAEPATDDRSDRSVGADGPDRDRAAIRRSCCATWAVRRKARRRSPRRRRLARANRMVCRWSPRG